MELTQIRLLVTDFTACYRFYRDVLGLTPQVDDERGPYAKLSPSGGGAAIALHDRGEMADVVAALAGAPTGHRALIALRVDDLDSAHADISARGGTFLGAPAPLGDRIRVAHLADPEGNLVELQEWTGARQTA
ncbi:VOC family protein [Streptomyces sp. NPDC051109]|uniref:VOC family protein n=1 Tax=Streptomyces sp. NPDC051109 TaxID=3365642 RepID=UPI0037A82E94